jgi:hypothetical protein
MRKILIILLIGGLLAPLFFGNHASAESMFRYSVYPALPSNQKEGVSNYFHLQGPFQEEQTLEFLIENPSDKELTLNLLPVTGTTSDHGDIQYMNEHDATQRELLIHKEYLFDPYIRVNTEKVTVASKGKGKASVTVYPPQ